MPWLAELVESSESSLDVLPVQCLCEFLLHDVPAEGSSSLLEDDDESKAEKYKRKQVSWMLTSSVCTLNTFKGCLRL